MSRMESLFSLSVDHEYYGGLCPDFRFYLPPDTQAEARRGRLVFRECENTLHCLFEADDSGNPIIPLPGSKLLIGLRLTTPYFPNYSAVEFSELTPLYRNAALPDSLSAPEAVRLAGEMIEQPLSDVGRPVIVRLKTRDGTTLMSTALSSNQHQNAVNFDCRKLPEGFYQVQESYLSGTFNTDYFRHRDLLKQGVFGIVEISLDLSVYSSPAQFTIPFLASQDSIKYYVVADNYTDTEFDSLSVSDHGFTADGRSEITFSRVLPADFTDDDLDSVLLQTGSRKLVMFKSDASEKRQNAPRRNIQLNKNGEILISHLPSPGADKIRQEFVIYLEKP